MSIRKHIVTCDGHMYQRTPKNVALRAIGQGKRFFLVGSNVREAHFFERWHLATFVERIQGIDEEAHNHHRHNHGKLLCIDDVHRMYASMAYHLHPELGRYPVFYVEIV